jgi:hypothetical protein
VREDVRSIAFSNLTRLTHRCFKLLDERLDKGDPVYDQNGDVVGYRAIKAKDLSTMITQLLDQSGEIAKRTEKPEENLDLLALAKSLENYAKEKSFERAKIIDGTPLQ